MTITIPSTSTAAHSPRLQPDRRSMKVTTGESTATLNTETKITRSAFLIDANAHAIATVPATSRTVWIDIVISTCGRPVSVAAVEGSDAFVC